jgi:membrane protease YdiL (CAAX protease family)
MRDVVLAFVVGLALGGGLAAAIFVVVELSGVELSETTLFSILTILLYLGFLAGAYLMVMLRRGVSLRDMGFVGVSGLTLVKTFFLTFGVQLLVGLVSTLVAPLVGEAPTARDQLVLGSGSLTVVEIASLLLAAAVVAPFVEELYFRGLIYKYLRRRSTVVWAIVITSFLFAATHLIWQLMPALFVLGAALAGLTERYKSVYPAVMLHALNNAVVVLIVVLS